MPSPALSRKIDILSKSASTPKALMDVIVLLVGEIEEQANLNQSLQVRVRELEANLEDPHRQVTKDHRQLLQSMEVLRGEAQQLENTIREAEASLSAHYEVRHSQLQQTLLQLQCEGERLVRDEIPLCIDGQLKHFAEDVKAICDTAVQTGAKALLKLKEDAHFEAREALTHVAGDSIDQLREEAQVLSYSLAKRLADDVDLLRKNVEDAAQDGMRSIHDQTSQCSSFLIDKVSDCVTFAPLLESHRLLGQVEFCAAQVNFLKDSTSSAFAVSTLEERLTAVERLVAMQDEGKQQTNPTFVQSPPSNGSAQKLLEGLLSLWELDEDVVMEMGSMKNEELGDDAEQVDPVISRMKTKYLHSLPVFRDIQSLRGVRGEAEPTATSARSALLTPPPSREHFSPVTPKEALLVELSARKQRTPKPLYFPASSKDDVVEHQAAKTEASGANNAAKFAFRKGITSQSSKTVKGASRNDVETGLTQIYDSLFGGTKDVAPSGPPTHSEQPQPFHEDDLPVNVSTISSITDGKHAAQNNSQSLEPLGIGVSDGDDVSGGVAVSLVVPLSPSERYGCKVGDVVMSVNGVRVSTRSDFAAALSKSLEEVKLHLYRPQSGKMHFVTVKRNWQK